MELLLDGPRVSVSVIAEIPGDLSTLRQWTLVFKRYILYIRIYLVGSGRKPKSNWLKLRKELIG